MGEEGQSTGAMGEYMGQCLAIVRARLDRYLFFRGSPPGNVCELKGKDELATSVGICRLVALVGGTVVTFGERDISGTA